MSKINTEKPKFPFVKIALTLTILIILVVYSRVIVLRVQERAYLEAESSFFNQKNIVVGASGYGQINNIRVGVGSEVSQGDILFTYVKNDFSVQQEYIIRAGAPGKIKKISSDVGSYITPDSNVMDIQSRDILIKSKIKIPPEDIIKLNVGSKTFTIAPDKKTYTGNITAIYPTYNNSDQTIEIESNISSTPENLLEGTPVKTKVYVGDNLAGNLGSAIEKIPFKPLQDFLS